MKNLWYFSFFRIISLQTCFSFFRGKIVNNFYQPANMKIVKLLFTLILISTNQYSYSQNKEIKTAKKYYEKAVEFESINIDSSFIYTKNAYNILKTKDTLNLDYADILNQFGRLFFHKKSFGEAYSFFDRCFQLTKLLGQNNQSYKVKVNMAICQRKLNNTEGALSSFFEVIQYYEAEDPKNINLGITYSNIADLYLLNKQHYMAEKFYKKTEPYFKEHKTYELQILCNRISNFNNIDLQKAIKISDSLETVVDIDSLPIFLKAPLYNNIGKAFLNTEQYTKALPYTLKALEIKKQSGINNDVSNQYNNIGKIYLNTNRYGIAIKYLDSALNQASSYKQRFEVLKNLQDAYIANKNPQKSLEFASKYIALKDSLNEVLTQKEIAELGIKYETDKKEKFIDRLQNLSLVYKVLIFTIILISGFILLRVFKKNKLIKSEFEILQQELDILKHEKSTSVQGAESKIINLKSKAVLNSSEILYIKSDGHYLEYYLDNKSTPEIDRNSLKEAVKSLSKNSFVQIHKSFIVNIYRIKIINSTKVMLDNGVWINLSRTYKQQLKDILHKKN